MIDLPRHDGAVAFQGKYIQYVVLPNSTASSCFPIRTCLSLQRYIPAVYLLWPHHPDRFIMSSQKPARDVLPKDMKKSLLDFRGGERLDMWMKYNELQNKDAEYQVSLVWRGMLQRGALTHRRSK